MYEKFYSDSQGLSIVWDTPHYVNNIFSFRQSGIRRQSYQMMFDQTFEGDDKVFEREKTKPHEARSLLVAKEFHSGYVGLCKYTRTFHSHSRDNP